MAVYRLTNRNRPIPNGISVIDACVNYQAPNFASFDAQVSGVMAARQGNPGLCSRYHLKTDRKSCEDFVDRYLGQRAHDLRYEGYYFSSAEVGNAEAIPFHQRHPGRNFGQAASLAETGVKTLAEMFGPEGPSDRDTAEANATVCAVCPLNDRGDWTRIFTVPAAAATRKLLELVKDEKFDTSKDSELKICSACGCPLRSKVWTRKEHILKHMPPGDVAALHPDCWITK